MSYISNNKQFNFRNIISNGFICVIHAIHTGIVKARRSTMNKLLYKYYMYKALKINAQNILPPIFMQLTGWNNGGLASSVFNYWPDNAIDWPEAA